MKMKIPIGAVRLSIAVGLLTLFNLAQASNDSICHTKPCKYAARFFLRTMNRTAVPCDNFYSYTCGSQGVFHSATHAKHDKNVYFDYTESYDPDPRTLIKSDEPIKPFRLLKTFFTSCMNSSRDRNLETFSNILSELGFDLEHVDGHWTQTGSFDWINTTKVLVDRGLINQLRSFVPNIEIEPSVIENSKPMITFGNTFRLDGITTHQLRQGKFDTDHSYIEKFVFDFFYTGKPIYEIYTIDIDKLRAEIFQNVFDFETKLFKVLDVRSYVQKIRLKRLAKKIPTIPWLPFVRTIVETLSNRSIGESEIIAIKGLRMMKKLGNLIRNTPSNVVLTYIAYTIHISYYGFIHMLNVDNKLDWCMSGNSFPDIMPALFTSRAMTPKDKLKKTFILRLSNKIRQTFIHLINEEWRWMDVPTKAEAIRKLESMSVVVVQSSPKAELKRLVSYYDGLELEDDGYWSVRLQIDKFWLKSQLERLQESFDILQTAVPSTSYKRIHLIDNMIYITLSGLREFVIRKNRPKYLNYISVGWDIAQIMASAIIGKTNTLFDEDRIFSWCSKLIKPKENATDNCFLNQYRKSRDGKIHVRFRIGDALSKILSQSITFRIVHLIFREWADSQKMASWKLPNLNNYTRDQMFFISAGLRYCQVSNDYVAPRQHVLQEIVRNFQEFNKAFSCTAGSLHHQ